MQARPSASDQVFHALGDATRRAIVAQLGGGPASVGELARPLPVSLAAVVQHVQVLEASGIVATYKQGRVRTCHLIPGALLEAERWLAQRRALWERRLDRLDALLAVGTPTGDAATTAPTTAPTTAATTEPTDASTEGEPA